LAGAAGTVAAVGLQFHLGLVLVALAAGVGSATLWLLASETLRPRLVGGALLAGVIVAGIAGAPRPGLGVALALVGVGLSGDRGPEVAGPSMRMVGVISLVGVGLAVQDTKSAVAIGAALVPVLFIESAASRPFQRGERWVLLAAVVAAVAGGANSVSAWAGGLACVGLLVSWAPIGPIGVAVHIVTIAAASRLVTRLHPLPAVLAAIGVVIGAAVFEALLSAAAPARRRP